MPSFKGYDARKLEGLFVTDKSCADELKKLSGKTELDIFQPNIASKSIRKERAELMNSNKLLWAQDYLTIVNHKAKGIFYDNSRDFLKRVLRAASDGLQKETRYIPIKSDPHLRGGNFFVCNNNGKKEILISENRQLYTDNLIKTIFNVEKIHTIPKMDYHLDLFIRPLDNGNVLVSDINMTKTGMQKGMEKIQQYIDKNNLKDEEKKSLEEVKNNLEFMIKKLEITLQFDKYKPHEIVSNVVLKLEEAGYKPIRVPATYHYLDGIKTKEQVQKLQDNFNNNAGALMDWSKNQSTEIQTKVIDFINLGAFYNKNNKNFGTELETFYENNFINAIVSKNAKDEIIYITNAALLDKKIGITPDIEQKTGFSTKKMFIESVAPYIKEENIYFINEKLTEKLFKFMGGIHCTAAEMPSI